MNEILGWEFHLGVEVPSGSANGGIDFTQSPSQVIAARRRWMNALLDALRYNDAWAILVTRPDGDVVLYDVMPRNQETALGAWVATERGGTAHLLLAREGPSRKPSRHDRSRR